MTAPKKGIIYSLFLEHPHSVNETYFQHMGFAFKVALKLFGAALAACLHAILPRVCQTTASRAIMRLYDMVAPR